MWVRTPHGVPKNKEDLVMNNYYADMLSYSSFDSFLCELQAEDYEYYMDELDGLADNYDLD